MDGSDRISYAAYLSKTSDAKAQQLKRTAAATNPIPSVKTIYVAAGTYHSYIEAASPIHM